MTLAIDREAEPLLRVNGAGRDFAGRGWGASGIFRAVDDVNLQVWRGDAANVETAQAAFLHRARMNALAAAGQWSAELEEAVPA